MVSRSAVSSNCELNYVGARRFTGTTVKLVFTFLFSLFLTFCGRLFRMILTDQVVLDNSFTWLVRNLCHDFFFAAAWTGIRSLYAPSQLHSIRLHCKTASVSSSSSAAPKDINHAIGNRSRLTSLWIFTRSTLPEQQQMQAMQWGFGTRNWSSLWVDCCCAFNGACRTFAMVATGIDPCLSCFRVKRTELSTEREENGRL
jgi:hypothetical protein